MSRGAVFISSNALGGEADAILRAADLVPVYMDDTDGAAPVLDQTMAAQTGPDGPVVAIISRTAPLTAEMIGLLPQLKIISKHGAGYDNIDVEAAKARGIRVTRVTGGNARSVAEHAIGLALALNRFTVPLAQDTAQGGWDRKTWIGQQLSDKTLGVIGFGQIGRETARIGAALFGRVLVGDPRADPEAVRATGAQPAPLEQVRDEADVISLHCPLTDSTRGLIDATFLAAMKPGGCIINTARGEVVDEAALLDALNAGHLLGAGLDSLKEESAGVTALKSHPSVIVTPHIGGSTIQAMATVAERSARNVVAHLAGEPVPERDLVA